MLRLFVLGSGSSGNALLVESGTGLDRARVLVDAGIGPKACATRLEALGVPPLDEGLHGIVVTHHHGDHFGQVERLARATKAPVWVHEGIDAERVQRVRRRFEVRDYVVRRPFQVGPFEIRAESVPHDAPQVALRVSAGGSALGIATDVGRATSSLEQLLASCDAAVLEANHCPEMLAFGRYPERLKHRVSGGLGHLSNGQAAALAGRLVGSRLTRLFLGHLSRENNTPERALETVSAAARGIDVSVIPHGAPCVLDVPPSRGVQLSLWGG